MSPQRGQRGAPVEKLVSQFVHAIETARLVESFIENYAAEYDRAGLTTHPVRHRELVATLGREVLLAMCARVRAVLPRRLRAGRKAVSRPQQEEAVEALGEDLVAALGERMDWSVAERRSFGADLHLYARLTSPAARPSRRRSLAQNAQGPFVDRCALLLDPAMLEQARRAAGEFLFGVERVTDKAIARVFRRPRQGRATHRRR